MTKHTKKYAILHTTIFCSLVITGMITKNDNYFIVSIPSIFFACDRWYVYLRSNEK